MKLKHKLEFIIDKLCIRNYQENKQLVTSLREGRDVSGLLLFVPVDCHQCGMAGCGNADGIYLWVYYVCEHSETSTTEFNIGLKIKDECKNFAYAFQS